MKKCVVLALLTLAGAAHADSIYVQHSGSNITWDPLYAHVANRSGPTPYEAEADLVNGTFRGYAAGAGTLDQNAYAGTGRNTLINISGQNLELRSGWFSAHIDGTIALSPAVGVGKVNATEIIGALTVIHNGTTYIASARQGAAIVGQYAPGSSVVTPRYEHAFGPLIETNGARVVENTAFLGFPSGIGALDFDLVMPTITLNPGDSFSWYFSFQNAVNTGSSAEADFYSTARLALVLPEGFAGALSNDGSNASAYTWITAATPPGPNPVPEPGTLLLVAGALGCWVWRRRA